MIPLDNIIDFRNIKNMKELTVILDSLHDQGFGYFNKHNAHKTKIDKLVIKRNTLNIEESKYRSEIDNLKNLKDYNEIQNKINDIFSKWSSDDKIMEYINTFTITPIGVGKTPDTTHTKDKIIIEWYKFKKRYNLKDDFEPNATVKFYNLDKKTIKINFGTNYKFEQFYKLLYNEDCPNLDKIYIGDWVDLGKIKMKKYQNGNVELDGDLVSYKEYFYKYLVNARWHKNVIILYNNKITKF